MSRTPEEREEYYYRNRERYNDLKTYYDGTPDVDLASLFIYLNKTCFNGLYRVNAKGKFNAASGKYKHPLICDGENILAVSERLQGVKIVCGDYRESEDFIDGNTFVYFDPPYRPLTSTAAFTEYTAGRFNDENQRELAGYVRRLSEKGAKVAVSNSDPRNSDSGDDFFDVLYEGNSVERVSANRVVNTKGSARGRVNELLIRNY